MLLLQTPVALGARAAWAPGRGEHLSLTHAHRQGIAQGKITFNVDIPVALSLYKNY